MRHLITALCLAVIFSVGGTNFAHAMSCDNKGAADRLHFGSNVSGEQVMICAEYWWPASPAKPVTPPKKSSGTRAKPVPNFFVVTPTKPKAFTFEPGELAVGQAFSVATSAANHIRKNTLLGRLAIVRFTPTRTTWNFGDGARAWVPRPTHSFAGAGTYRVFALVTFAVKFRFVGTTRWFSDPRGITIQTNALTFRVTSVKPPAKPSRRVLVLFDCLASARLGC